MSRLTRGKQFSENGKFPVKKQVLTRFKRRTFSVPLSRSRYFYTVSGETNKIENIINQTLYTQAVDLRITRMQRQLHYLQTKWKGVWKLLRFDNKATPLSYKCVRNVVYGGKPCSRLQDSCFREVSKDPTDFI